MPVRRRAIDSVLRNFLDRLSSRYSDYDGYWIFGLFVAELSRSTIDLLANTPPASASPAWNAFVTLARGRFADQAKLNSVTRFVRRAELSVEKGPSRSGMVNGLMRDGYEVTLAIDVASDLGRSYRQETSFFVAPHDPSIATRSIRRGMDAAMQRGAARRARL